MFDQDERNQIFEIEEQPQPNLLRRMPWWLIGSIALVIGKLTTHPAIGVVVLCLKLGWNDFLIGLWLRRRDPDRVRGAVCSWFYWALGLWRVGFGSFVLLVTLMLIIFTLIDIGVEVRNDHVELGVCTLILYCSVGLALGTTLIGLVRGRMTGQRIWLSSSILESYRRREWPPVAIEGAPNQFGLVVGVTVLFTILTLMPIVSEGVFGLVGRLQMQPGKPNAAQIFGGITIGVGVLVGGVCIALWACSAVIDRLSASNPAQCWPPSGEVDESSTSASDGEA